MKCQKCDYDNQEDSIFCNKCGNKLASRNANQTVEKKDKRSIFKNKKAMVAIASLTAGIICSFLDLNSPMNAYKNNIRNNQAVTASEIYDTKIKGNKEKENKTKSFLVEEINSIEDLFENNKIEFSEAKTRLETINHTGLVASTVKFAIGDIEELNESRISYLKASEFLNEKNITEAIKEYSKVIKKDENYETSQKQIKNLTDNYKKDVLKMSEAASNNQDYEKAVSLLQEANLLIPGNSDVIAKLAVYE